MGNPFSLSPMLKFCAMFRYYNLNAIEKSKVAGKVSTSFPIAEIPFITFCSYYIYIEALPTKCYRVYKLIWIDPDIVKVLQQTIYGQKNINFI